MSELKFSTEMDTFLNKPGPGSGSAPQNLDPWRRNWRLQSAIAFRMRTNDRLLDLDETLRPFSGVWNPDLIQNELTNPPAGQFHSTILDRLNFQSTLISILSTLPHPPFPSSEFQRMSTQLSMSKLSLCPRVLRREFDNFNMFEKIRTRIQTVRSWTVAQDKISPSGKFHNFFEFPKKICQSTNTSSFLANFIQFSFIKLHSSCENRNLFLKFQNGAGKFCFPFRLLRESNFIASSNPPPGPKISPNPSRKIHVPPHILLGWKSFRI